MITTKLVESAGYPGEMERARETFGDAELEVEHISIGMSSSKVTIKGYKGQWNSVLFDLDIDDPCLPSSSGYKSIQRSIEKARERDCNDISIRP